MSAWCLHSSWPEPMTIVSGGTHRFEGLGVVDEPGPPNCFARLEEFRLVVRTCCQTCDEQNRQCTRHCYGSRDYATHISSSKVGHKFAPDLGPWYTASNAAPADAEKTE